MPRLVWSAWVLAMVLAAMSCTTFGTDSPDGSADGGGTDAGATGDGPATDASGPETSTDADAGDEDAARPTCAGEASCERYVFVSSERFTGEDIGGAIGGDGRCNAYAARAGTLPKLAGRAFQAWLSDDLANFTASARLTHGTKPYRLVDGTLVANDWSQLTSGSVLHPIDVTEQGLTVGQDFVWTGTSALGQLATKTCTNWSLNGSDNTGAVGRASAQDSAWTNAGLASCGTAHRLYCFEK